MLNAVGPFAAVAALLGATLTLLHVAGLVERRDAALGRPGIDSWSVLAVHAVGLALLHALR